MPSLVERLKGALWGIFIADALSMPAHWYYDTAALRRDFGRITQYEAPRPFHPNSIMSLSATGAGGRGDQRGSIIGDVINHGKREWWGKKGVHYHQGMRAGENTLNAQCARVTMRSITAAGGVYQSDHFLDAYVEFLTTPGSHNDTYAESFHRDFFANWARGVPPEDCAGAEGHNTATIGGFVMLPPVILSVAAASGQPPHAGVEAAAVEAAARHLRLTHRSPRLAQAAEVYTRLLLAVVGGVALRAAVEEAAGALRIDLPRLLALRRADEEVVGGTFGSACYIEDSLPSLLYLAYKYSDGAFEEALLANTNVGGENCHRGSALGAVLGAAHGLDQVPLRLRQGLAAGSAIDAEIDAFAAAVTAPARPARRPAEL